MSLADRRTYAAAVGLLLALALVPLFAKGYVLSIAILVLQYAYLGQSWNIMTGFAGQLSLGHALFVGLGGYVTAILSVKFGLNVWLSALAGGATGAIAGILVGFVGFRFALRGIYFALLTLAVAEFFRILFDNWDFVGASSGFVLPALPEDNNPWMSLRGTTIVYFYLYLAMNVVALAVCTVLLKGRTGYLWRAIQADEQAARAAGVPAFRLKVMAAALSGGMTAIGGGAYVLFVGNLYSDTVFSLAMSINVLVGPVVGGLGTLVGPIVGALIVVPLGELTNTLAERFGISGLSTLVYGLVLIVIVLFMPEGVWPRLRSVLRFGRAIASAPGRASASAEDLPLPPAALASGLTAPAAAPAAPLLRLDGVSKSFRGLQAVNNVSFEVPEGGIVALIGPNGAGKTTCFNLISGAVAPDSGRIEFAGRALAGVSPEGVCVAGIGRTFQIVRPFHDMTVLENVMVGALLRERDVGRAREQAEALLARFGFSDKADAATSSLTLPDRKLVEVVRALATRPRLLLLDEVMAGLRPAEYAKIVRVLRELNSAGLTILLIEHVMRVVMELAKHVVVLHHGEKSTEGTPEQVTQDPRTIENYFGRRTRP